MAYNTSVHKSTGFTPKFWKQSETKPSLMMFGREMNLPIELKLGKPVDEITKSTTEYVTHLENNLERIHEITRRPLKQSGVNMKNIYDRGKHVIIYSIGDAVWYCNLRRQRNLSPKLQSPWLGPYIITQKYGEVLYEIRPKNMINKIGKERRHSMNAAPTRPSNKRQRQGAQEDPKEKQDRHQRLKL
jgi:hypothetical protein